MTRLTEIKKRLGEATPGPWGCSKSLVYLPNTIGGFDLRGSPNNLANATFIAHAPSDIEWLLSELEKAETVAKAALNMHQQCEAQNTRLREALDLGVELIRGDLVGPEWKRGCADFIKAAREAEQ